MWTTSRMHTGPICMCLPACSASSTAAEQWTKTDKHSMHYWPLFLSTYKLDIEVSAYSHVFLHRQAKMHAQMTSCLGVKWLCWLDDVQHVQATTWYSVSEACKVDKRCAYSRKMIAVSVVHLWTNVHCHTICTYYTWGVRGSSVWMMGSELIRDTNLVYTSSTLSQSKPTNSLYRASAMACASFVVGACPSSNRPAYYVRWYNILYQW